MAKPCSVCARPDRAEIDARLAAGASLRTITASTGISKSSIDRHRRGCGLRNVVAVPAVVELIEPAPSLPTVVSGAVLAPIASPAVNPLVADALAMRRTTEERQAIIQAMAHETAVQAMEGAAPNVTNSRVKALKLYASTITIDAAMTEARAKVAAERKQVDGTIAFLVDVLSPSSSEDFTAFARRDAPDAK